MRRIILACTAALAVLLGCSVAALVQNGAVNGAAGGAVIAGSPVEQPSAA